MGRRGLGETEPGAFWRKWGLLSPSQMGGFGRPNEPLPFVGYCHGGLQTCTHGFHGAKGKSHEQEEWEASTHKSCPG